MQVTSRYNTVGGRETIYTYACDVNCNILTANGHTYTYGNADWKDLLTAYDGEAITYDAIGNPLSYYNGTRWTFTWEDGRQLATATDGTTNVSYTYDSDGIRTSKTVNGVKHTYVYASGKLLRETYGSNTLDFFYSTSGQPYALKHNGTIYYYITNLQGDVMSIVDGTGAVVVSYKYDPYGNILSTTGTLADTLGQINPLRYRGYVYDQECNLYYLQSRYYDPSIGRFLNADAFASTGQGILGYNMFPYCLNNPVNHTDKTGMTSDSYAGWVGEQIGELIYEWITGNDHPSHQTRELETRVRQKQNEQIGKGFKSIGGGVKSIWDAYMRGYAREQDAMLRQAQMNLDRFDSPEDIEKSIDVIEATGGFATAAYGVAYVTILSPASPIVVAVAIGGLIWAGRGLIREVL